MSYVVDRVRGHDLLPGLHSERVVAAYRFLHSREEEGQDGDDEERENCHDVGEPGGLHVGVVGGGVVIGCCGRAGQEMRLSMHRAATESHPFVGHAAAKAEMPLTLSNALQSPRGRQRLPAHSLARTASHNRGSVYSTREESSSEKVESIVLGCALKGRTQSLPPLSTDTATVCPSASPPSTCAASKPWYSSKGMSVHGTMENESACPDSQKRD